VLAVLVARRQLAIHEVAAERQRERLQAAREQLDREPLRERLA
jgi:hypothetical protein